MLDIKVFFTTSSFLGTNVELKPEIENSICIEFISGLIDLISCVENNKINGLKYSSNEHQSLETSTGAL